MHRPLRKKEAEDAIVARRDQECKRAQRNEAAATYHRDLNLRSVQYSNIERTYDLCTKLNEESNVQEAIQEDRKQKLQAHKQRLSDLFEDEDKLLFAELHVLKEAKPHASSTESWPVQKMREQLEALKWETKEVNESVKEEDYQFNRISRVHVKPYTSSTTSGCYKTEILDEEMTKSVKLAEEKKQAMAKKEASLKQQLEATSQQLRDLKWNHMKSTCHWEEVTGKLETELSPFTLQLNKNSSAMEMMQKYKTMTNEFEQKRTEIRSIIKKKIDLILQLPPSKDNIRKMSNQVRNLLAFDLESVTHFLETQDLIELQIGELKGVERSLLSKITEEEQWFGNLSISFNEQIKEAWKGRYEKWVEMMHHADECITQGFKHVHAAITRREGTLEATIHTMQKEIAAVQAKMDKIENTVIDETKLFRDKRCYYNNAILELERRLNSGPPF